MIDKLRQIIKDELVKLPKESQEVINSFEWEKISEEIGKRYLLSENEINDLQREIFLVFSGIVEEDFLSLNIENRVGTSKNEAIKITEEINQKILDPMLEKIEAQSDEFSPSASDLRFNSLPKEVQEAVAKSGWKEKLYEIAKKYKLNIEQMGILEDETVKTLVNITHPEQYEEKLSSKINISKEDIANLIKDVNESIFQKIREGEKVITKEEEVPLPPYAGTIKNDELKITNEKETPKAIENVTPIISKPEIPIDNSKNIMSSMEEKLKNPTVSDHTISDHSNSSIKPADPYRESF